MEMFTPALIEKLMQYPILLLMLYFIWTGQKNVTRMIDVMCKLVEKLEEMITKA